MPRLRKENNRGYILRKDELFVKHSVKKKNKLVVRVVSGNPFEALAGKPPNAFEPVFDKQPGIYSYFQHAKFNSPKVTF